MGANGECDGNTSYRDPYLGDARNDRISQAKGYNRCKFVLFEHRDFNGGRIVCGFRDKPQPNPGGWCASMSIFDNETSSARWHD